MHTESEGNLQDSVFSFHHESPGERTQNFGIGSKRLYSLSYLTSPRLIFCMRLSRCLASLVAEVMYSLSCGFC